MIKEEILERLLKRRIIKDGHWLYNGSLNSCKYGTMNVEGKTKDVHRLSAWIYLNLNIDDSTQHALHKRICTIRHCFNPDHLYIGIHQDNIQDAIDMNHMKGKIADNEYCPKGHKRTKENTRKVFNSRCKFVNRCLDCRRLRGN